MAYLDDLMNESYQREAQRLYQQQPGHQPQQQQPQQSPAPQTQIDPVYAYYMGTPQQEEQPTTPQQSEGGLFSGFFRGAKSGGAGVIGGQAGLGNLYGIGDGATQQWANEVGQANARKKEYGITDMLPFSTDYWTNGEGFAYDLGNALGSSAVLGAETAAVMSGVGAVAGALGIGGAGVAAATAGMGSAGRAAYLGQYAVKSVAGKMAQSAEKAGLHTLSKVLQGPAGQMYALNILRTPFEVSSEMGNAGQDALKEPGVNIDEARKRAWVTGAVQAPLLALSNTLEAGNLGKLLSKDIVKAGGKNKLIDALGGITMEAFQNAWEEGMQQSAQEYAADKQDLLGVVNPFQWSPEARAEAAAGFTSGIGIGGGSAAMNHFVGGENKKQKVDDNAPSVDDAKSYLNKQIESNPNLQPEDRDAIRAVLADGNTDEIITAAEYYEWKPTEKKEETKEEEKPKQPETPDEVLRSAIDDETIDERKRGYYGNALDKKASLQEQIDTTQAELDSMVETVKTNNPDISKKALNAKVKEFKDSKEYKDKASKLATLKESLKKTNEDITKMSKRITQNRRSAEISAMTNTQTEYGDEPSQNVSNVNVAAISDSVDGKGKVRNTPVKNISLEERAKAVSDAKATNWDGTKESENTTEQMAESEKVPSLKAYETNKQKEAKKQADELSTALTSAQLQGENDTAQQQDLENRKAKADVESAPNISAQLQGENDSVESESLKKRQEEYVRPAREQAKKDRTYYAPRSQAEADLWKKWDGQVGRGIAPNFESNKESADRYKNYSSTYLNSEKQKAEQEKQSLAPQNDVEKATYKRWSSQLKKGKKPSVSAKEKELFERFKKYRGLQEAQDGNKLQQSNNKVQAVSVQDGQSKENKQPKTEHQSKGTSDKTEKVDTPEYSISRETIDSNAKELDNSYIVKLLRKLGYTVYTDKDNWDKSSGGKHQQTLRLGGDESATVLGVCDNETIYINPESLRPDTPIHEYIHLWVKMIEKADPKLWSQGKELLKQTETWKALAENPYYANLNDEDRYASEVIAKIGGVRGSFRQQDIRTALEQQGESKGLIDKIINWFGKFFRKTQVSVAPTQELKGMSVWSFVNRPVDDLIGGLKAETLKAEKDKKAVEDKYSTDNSEYQIGYHGTTTNFDRFSTDHIGTGTGVQTHGWGLYFSESKDVADQYRLQIANDKGIKAIKTKDNIYTNQLAKNGLDNDSWVDKNGNEYKKGTPAFKALESFAFNEDYDDALDDVSKDKQAQQFLKDAGNAQMSDEVGYVKKAEIPEDVELLDEDERLSKQPQKQAIVKLLKDNNIRYRLDNFGNEIYQKVSEKLGSDEKASKEFAKYGIKGLVYSEKEEGTSRVVFDSKFIDENKGDGSEFSIGKIKSADSYVPKKVIAQAKQDANKLIADIKDASVVNATNLKMTDTPEILKQWINGDNISISKGKIKEAMKPETNGQNHRHGIRVEDIRKVIPAMHEPVFVIKSHDNRVVVFTDIEDYRHRSIIVPVEISPNNGDVVSLANSIYGRNAEDIYIIKNQLDGNLVYANSKKSPAWADSYRLQLPKNLLKQGFVLENSIAQKYGIVNYNDSVHTESPKDENGVEFQILDQNNPTEKKIIDKLNKDSKEGKTFKAYRAMALIDGKLYPPMATKVDSKNLAPASELGQWEKAVENPNVAFYNPKGSSVKLKFDDIKPVKKDGKWQAEVNGKWVELKTDDETGEPALYFELRKDDGTSVAARYNPYLHSSKYMLNDQFSGAYTRPNLVVVEMELPNSELTSEYKAKYAKDPVGQTKWKAGPVAGELAKLNPEKARDVFITRWGRPIRVVPVDEVAQAIKEQIGDSGVGIPINTVTPDLAKALKKAGVKLIGPEKKVAKKYTETMGEFSDTEFSIDSPKFKKWFGDWQAEIDRKAGKLQGTSYTVKEAEDALKGDILSKLEELSDEFGEKIKLVGLKIHGSRVRQTAKKNSDIDVVVQYDGDVREDALFDALNEEPLTLDGIKVDINPITEDLKNYLARDEQYDRENGLKVSKLVDEDGKPKVFYRGISEIYDVGKQGEVTWISEDKDQADDYAGTGRDSNTLSVYARVENPIYLGNSWTDHTVTSVIKNKLYEAVNRSFLDGRITAEQGLALHEEMDELIKKDDKQYKPLFEIYNDVPEILDFIKRAGYDAIKVDESGHTTYGVIGKSNVKSATNNNGNYDADNDHIEFSIVDSSIHAEKFDAKQKEAIDKYLSEKENKPLAERLKAPGLKDTPWARESYKSILWRMAARELIAGREPDFYSSLSSVKKAYNLLLKKGVQGALEYCEDYGFIGAAEKPLRAINASYLNCHPSVECAKFCYAANGVNLPTVLNKQEMVNFTIEEFPLESARLVAKQYSAMPGSDNTALRILDRGDVSEKWLPFIKEVNRLGVTLQIFSKRPELLAKIDGKKNVAMLSVDSSNFHLADQYKDFPLAFVWRGPEDNARLEKERARFEKLGGVILPVKLSTGVLGEDVVSKLPSWTKNLTCPVDKGTTKIGEYNCTMCDQGYGVGCFFHKVTARLAERLAMAENLTLDETNDMIDRIMANTLKEFAAEGKTIDEKQQQQLRELLGIINASGMGRNDSRRKTGENRQNEGTPKRGEQSRDGQGVSETEFSIAYTQTAPGTDTDISAVAGAISRPNVDTVKGW